MQRSVSGGAPLGARLCHFFRGIGITVIEGGCPLMFAPTSDGGHKMLKTFGTWMGKVPRKVEVVAAHKS